MSRLQEEVLHVRPVELEGVGLRAIQTTTAAPMADIAHILPTEDYRGPVSQSEIDPDSS